jgi:hypothetical protein
MKDSPLARIVLVLVVLLVIWNIYRGATVQKIGIPGLFSIDFGSTRSKLSGSWKYTLRSDVSQQAFNGSMDLAVDGDIVSGTMDNPDPQRSGERSSVHGNYVNGTLTLTRDTNRDGVMQEYRLTSNGAAFKGAFHNIGQTGYFKDSGTFEIHR